MGPKEAPQRVETILEAVVVVVVPTLESRGPMVPLVVLVWFSSDTLLAVSHVVLDTTHAL
jgi:hypothetical protein